MRKGFFCLLTMMGLLTLSAQQQDIELDADGIMRVNDPITIVCIGNSITDGYSNTSRDWAWPAQLNRLLGPDYLVLNYAVSGTCMGKKAPTSYWKTDNYTKAKAANPDILVIAHGTNDADPWRWDQWGEEFHDDYIDMVTSFREKGRDPILYVALPTQLFSKPKEKQNHYIEDKVIPKIKEIAAELGVKTINFHTHPLDRPELFPDNVHPSDRGAALMAELARDIIAGQQQLSAQIKVKKGTVVSPTMVVVEPKSSVELIPEAPTSGSWLWTGPNGFTAKKRVLSLKKLTSGGVYTVRFQDNEGNRSILSFLVSIRGQKAGSIMPHICIAGSSWQQTTTLSVRPGQDVTFGPSCSAGNDAGTWSWRGPNGFFSASRQMTINTMTPAKAGRYGVTYTDAQGRQTTAVYTIKVEGEPACPLLVSHIRGENGWKQTNTMAVKAGASVTFGPQPLNGKWTWTGPNGFHSEERQNQLFDFNADMAGEYIGTYTNEAGCKGQVVITLTLE